MERTKLPKNAFYVLKLTFGVFFLFIVVFIPNASADGTTVTCTSLPSNYTVYVPTVWNGISVDTYQTGGDVLNGVSNTGFWSVSQFNYDTGTEIHTLSPLYGSTGSIPSFDTIRNEHGTGQYIFTSNVPYCGTSIGFAIFTLTNTGVLFSSVISTSGVSTTPKYIVINDPKYGTTTIDNNVNISITYRTPLSLDFRPTTTRHFEIRDAVTSELNYQYDSILPENTGENITINMNISVATGSKIMSAQYLDLNGNAYSEIATTFFNVATNTYLMATGLNDPNQNASTLTQIQVTCGSFDVGCQVQKAIVFLFYPSANSLDRFGGLWHNIETKRPFGYVTVTIDQLKTLDTNGTSTYNLGTVPFQDSIFTPFRIAIGSLLWGIFAIYFYRVRLKNLDI
jgi:hypothetical protein